MAQAKFRPYKTAKELLREITVKADGDGRTICGYAASFNTVDSDNDMFQRGAFAKSLIENKDRIVMLLQHNTQQPIGRPTVLAEDEMGLYFETPIAQSTLGDDVLAMYKAGVYNEHSVGFEMINCMPATQDSQSYNLITEAKLWEFSTVTWGANQNTPVIDIKGLERVFKRKQMIDKSLTIKGLASDTYSLLEIELKQLLTLLESAQSLQPGKTTEADKHLNLEPTAEQKLYKELNNIKF